MSQAEGDSYSMTKRRLPRRGEPRLARLVAPTLAGLALAACGGAATDTPPDFSLTPEGQIGLETMRTSGCGACHGANGQGVEGLGPAFQSLFGSNVTLSDGTVVVADRQYLQRSIVEPHAQIVADYGLPMPPYDLSPEDLNAVLTFLEELG